MKGYRFTVIALFMMIGYSADAQFSISRVKPKDVSIVQRDSIKRNSNVTNDYFSQSKWLAEKKRIRKERNTVNFESTFQLTQTQFENWASGGDNTFSGKATMDFKHRYQREKIGFEYWFNARYGINIIEDKPFKNEDEFKLGFKADWKIKNSWSYETAINLRSQFSNGYASRTDKTLRSTFMSPGFFEVSVGINYKNSKSPFNISLSPIAGNFVVVRNDTLSKQGSNGVDPGKHVKGRLGPSLRVIFDKEFGKNIFRFYSNLYAFTNIRRAHNARWENKLDIRATKFLTTTIFGICYYNNEVTTPKKTLMQYNYSFSIGLSYRFKNK